VSEQVSSRSRRHVLGEVGTRAGAVGDRVLVRHAEAVQHAEVLGVVDDVVKVQLPQLEEGGARQERVAAGLVLRADALDVEVVGEVVEAALEVLAALHHVLDVVDARKVRVHEVEEALLVGRQRRAREDLEQVGKVVARVEAEPLDAVVEHEARRHEQLAERVDVDAALVVLLEVDAAAAQQVYRVRRAHVLSGGPPPPPPPVSPTRQCEENQDDQDDQDDVLDIELKVELPRADAGSQGAGRVREREAELDDVEHVDVDAQRLVVVVARALEGADRPRWYAREFSVLGPREHTHAHTKRDTNTSRSGEWHRSLASQISIERDRHTMPIHWYSSTALRINSISSSNVSAHTSRITTGCPLMVVVIDMVTAARSLASINRRSIERCATHEANKQICALPR